MALRAAGREMIRLGRSASTATGRHWFKHENAGQMGRVFIAIGIAGGGAGVYYVSRDDGLVGGVAGPNIQAFKGTHAGGRPKHGNETYEVGKTYTLEGEARLCENGYHASQRADDVFTYYENPDEIYEVTIAGSTDIGDDKICGTVMVVERQLSPFEIVKTMEDKNKALCWAAENGHKEMVELLLPLSDPKASDSETLRHAVYNGYKEIVELLLPLSDSKAEKSRALRWAALKGHKEIVELLIPASDPKARDSEALRWAARNGHKEIVELLIPVSDSAVVEELGLA